MIPNEIKNELLKLVDEKLGKLAKELNDLKATLCEEIDELKVELAILKEGGDI